MMKPAAFVKTSILMGLALLSAMPVAGVLSPSLASAQADVRQEDRRADRHQDRQNDRREDRRADRGSRGR